MAEQEPPQHRRAVGRVRIPIIVRLVHHHESVLVDVVLQSLLLGERPARIRELPVA